MHLYKIPEAKIRAVLDDNFFYKNQYFGSLTSKERAALELAERMTEICICVTEEFYAQIKPYFSDEEYVLLAAIIGIMNFRSKFNHAMAIHSMGLSDSECVKKKCEEACCCLGGTGHG